MMKELALAALVAGGAGAARADSLVVVSAGGKRFAARVEDSETGRAFAAKLPLALSMSELNGNEKYAYGVALPAAPEYRARVEAGDLMLYGSNCVVLFYGEAGGYSYTRIGKLVSADGLAAALGGGAADVTFEKAELRAGIQMDGDLPLITAATNLPEGTPVETLAVKALPADETDWKDYDTLDAEEKADCRFFRLRAHVDR